MWIMKPGYESVNMDYVQSIYKSDTHCRLTFYQFDNIQAEYSFDSGAELDNYYNELMFQLGSIQLGSDHNSVKL